MGRNTANKYHCHVWGVLAVYGPHWVCPQLMACVLSWSTPLRLQVALQVNCPKWALDFMHFPDLSCSGSGSQILHKDTDSVECVFSALPRFKQLRRPVLASALHLNHLPNPGCSVSQMCCNSAISDVPCVSPGELISGCNPPGRCQPSRIPERLG